MGTDERPPVGALVERLGDRPQGFNLFQAISLLERASPQLAPVGKGDGQTEAVRLKSVVSLGFQPSDVSRVSAGAEDAEAWVLATPVLSLAGAQGPLPLPFTEMVLERTAARDHATADFLDIFNHRLGSPQGESSWLRHAGLLGGAPRSMTGLLAMLSDRLGVVARGRQFCGGWRDLEPRDITRLAGRTSGRAPRLGRSAVLGKRVWDQGAGITLELSGLTLRRLRRLLRGGEEHALLGWMVGRYLQQDVGVEMVLHIDGRELRPCILGQKEPLQLGWTSWLVSSTPYTGTFAPARFKLHDDAVPGMA
ncbi:type VI secretion system baseplate subunit TssG [Polaromonas sp. 16-63-31]|uniref:type VI secretion system baseplate subunit TssG n=1 Tax=Polaromonas sp. 16-63-31 TaxID=1970412 RepID=UPI0025FC4E5E|nr:type VI secretion system baseplate subunit TssG [Polaromonas sp. 16-63-31]